MPPPLTGAHRRTYKAIFVHPVWSNLCWHEVRSLFRQLGRTETLPDGSVKVTCREQTLLLHPPHFPDVATTDEIKTLREFLERCESVPAGEAKPKEKG